MSKRTNLSYIYIDGEKFKELLEGASGKTLKQISLENGFSDSFLRMVVKNGKASPSAQAVARLYGIEPSAYRDKPVEPKPERVTTLRALEYEREQKQITFDDLITEDARDALKAIVKEAVREVLAEELKDVEVIRKPKRAEDYLRALDPERKEDEQRKFDKRFEI